jgi:hypothetical protein
MDNVSKESAMSTIEIGAARETTAEFLPELAAGLAIVVLTILGLAGVSPTFLAQIAAVLCCVDLFSRRVTKAQEFNQLFS